MKFSVLKSFALLCAGAVLFTACRGNDDDEVIPTYYNTIQGEWTLSFVGADLNGNNTIDANEIYPAADTNIVGNITFNADRSGYAYANYESFPLPGSSFTYTIEQNGTKLVTLVGESKLSSNITTLDNNNLVLLNKSTGFANGIWLGFVK